MIEAWVLEGVSVVENCVTLIIIILGTNSAD